jgi:hypothetical protein
MIRRPLFHFPSVGEGKVERHCRQKNAAGLAREEIAAEQRGRIYFQNTVPQLPDRPLKQQTSALCNA